MSTTAFAPDGSEALGRTLCSDRLRPDNREIVDFYKLDAVIDFLAGFEGTVALQLGDRFLADSMAITRHLRHHLPSCTFAIVADSTYGQGDVDEISAKHLGCGKIVFFGDGNLKQRTDTGAFFVRIEHCEFDLIEAKVAEVVTDLDDYVIVSTNVELLKRLANYNTRELDLQWTNKVHYNHAIYIGASKDDKIVAWCMQNQPDQLISIHPSTGEIKKNPFDTGRLLMQRFHLIEKAKDAERVGLVLGSNGGHQLSVQCLSRLRELSLAAGKTPYTVVVGDPTPQKLANFPELDVFVLVGSPESSILSSRGYYKPVIHPWEMAMACTGREWDGAYWANWEKMLGEEVVMELKEHDISLITGRIRTVKSQQVTANAGETSVMIKGAQEIAEMACHRIRQDKAYFGLEDDKKDGPSELRDGTTGIAQGYKREPDL